MRDILDPWRGYSALGEHRDRRCQPLLQTKVRICVRSITAMAYLSPLVLRIRPTAVSLELPFDSETVPSSFQSKISSTIKQSTPTISHSLFLFLSQPFQHSVSAFSSSKPCHCTASFRTPAVDTIEALVVLFWNMVALELPRILVAVHWAEA